jgi:hypothetical protein
MNTARGDVCLPLEFTLAAFRFGHSMARETYALNGLRPPRRLDALVNRRRDAADPLSDRDLLEWGRFFPGLQRSAPTVFARKINPHVVDALHSVVVPDESPIDLSGVPQLRRIDLTVRTLRRGSRATLVSGQEAAAVLGEPVLPTAAFMRDQSTAGQKLRKLDLTRATPLWYYILREAEAVQRGERLGRLGSRVVQDTIEEVMQNDPDSYLSHQRPNWQPARWKFPDRKANVREPLNTVGDLVRLVGDNELLSG